MGNEHNTSRDDGYTLIEMLLVVLILGILTSAVVLVVTGMSSEAAATGCLADKQQLQKSAEAYFAQVGGEIPADGSGPDRYELTLSSAEFLRAPSTMHNVDGSGVVTVQEGSSC